MNRGLNGKYVPLIAISLLMILGSITWKLYYQEKVVVYRVTAYCPCVRCCGKFADGITASGYRIQAGDKFVAADKKFVFGTVLRIPGYGVVPVLDRGGAIKDGCIDVYFDTHSAALRWGVQYLEVEVVK